MKKLTLSIAALVAATGIYAQDFKKVHEKAIVIDTHNDILTSALQKGLVWDQDLTGKTHSDLNRFLKAGIDVQVFSVFCNETYGKGKAYARANQQIDTLDAVIARNPQKIKKVTTPQELQTAVREKKLGAMIGVEGGHMIEDNLSYLDALYERGARYLTLTWNNSTSWATSAMDEEAFKKNPTSSNGRKIGLNDFGVKVVKRMNELGMMVDLSHVGEQTFWDAINTTTKPVIVSHSCAHSINPVFRNLTDEQIKAVAKNGGVIHVNFYASFLDADFVKKNNDLQNKKKAEREEMLKTKDAATVTKLLNDKYAPLQAAIRPPLSKLIDHIDHIVKVAGVDHVGLGSDFDGISAATKELDDITDMNKVTKALLAKGYSTTDVEKILGGNFIRLFTQNAQ
ncbi:dipeptidase [Gynurincola endophyticus]|uniref:dipeptidase n=1 Tax=Gynurincola endophyticus TaxID=2479004 RepID=UPI000F8DF419|nr:dipeptidase [Gynurincola endophyticus]